MRDGLITLALGALVAVTTGCGGGGSGSNTAGNTTLTITINALADATQGVAYSATLTASGGTAPYSWSIASGNLPDGLTLTAATGEISGFPMIANTFDFTVRCTDDAANSAIKVLSITVMAAGGGGGGGGGSYAWSQITPGGTIPAGRSSHASIADPVGMRMIATLGSTGSSSVLTDNVALSLANGTEAWSTLLPGTGPTGRWGHSAVYDNVRNRLILFGGNVNGFQTANDVWQLTLTPGAEAWSQLSPGGSTVPIRVAHGAIYDPINDRMIVYGGGDGTNFNPSMSVRADVWALNFSGSAAGSWAQLTPTGTPPAGRLAPVFIYDANDQRIIMFGGDTPSGALGDVWELDVSTPGSEKWTMLTPAGTPPAARRYAAGAYDPVRDTLVMFGGENGFDYGDVWELSLGMGTEAWTSISPSGAGPAPRDSHTAVYDAVNRRIVFYAGFTMFPSTPFTDAWALSLP